VSVFTESINGADGLAFDDDGRLWAAANQNDEVAAVNDKGRVIVRLGEFRGIDRHGAPRGLLFPASLVIVDDWMYRHEPRAAADRRGRGRAGGGRQALDCVPDRDPGALSASS
jgi:hypothetical protein